MSFLKIQTRLALGLRISLIVIGGYMLTGGVTALIGITMSVAGMASSDAMLLSSMLGFLFYVGLVIWGFSARQYWWRSLTIFGSATVTMSLAYLLVEVG